MPRAAPRSMKKLEHAEGSRRGGGSEVEFHFGAESP